MPKNIFCYPSCEEIDNPDWNSDGEWVSLVSQQLRDIWHTFSSWQKITITHQIIQKDENVIDRYHYLHSGDF